MRFTIKELEEKSKHRPQGYREEVLNLAIKLDDYFYELDDESFKVLAQKWRLPSLFQEIKNLAKAAQDAASSGFDVRNGEEVEKCLMACSECPYLVTGDMRCGSCGCQLSYKTQLKSWHCPLGKW
jgi:hypothetical protein